MSKRQFLARVLCTIIFLGAVWGAVRLSHPPDPYAAAARRAARDRAGVTVDTERDVMTLRQGREARRYRFYETDRGVMVREVDEVDEEP